jgi:hypothetical protein
MTKLLRRFVRFIGNRFIGLGAALLALALDDYDDARDTLPDGRWQNPDVTQKVDVPRWN